MLAFYICVPLLQALSVIDIIYQRTIMADVGPSSVLHMLQIV